MYLAVSVFTGFLVALMIQFNGVLQIAAGGTAALLAIHLSGLSGSLIFMLIFRRRFRGDRGLHSPKFYLAAGMLGAGVVYLASLIFEKGGILLSLSGSLAGQTLAASVSEGFYPPGRMRSPVFQRIISPALLLPASFIIGLKAGVALVWIIVSWTPGIILMIQQSMNSRNTARYGSPATVVFNYVSALLLIIPLFFVSGGLSGRVEAVNSLPWFVVMGGGLIGVFTTGVIAYLLLKAPAVLVILGIYSGEIAGGIVLDMVNGNSIAVEKLIGISLIAAGLLVGKLRKTASIEEIV